MYELLFLLFLSIIVGEVFNLYSDEPPEHYGCRVCKDSGVIEMIEWYGNLFPERSIEPCPFCKKLKREDFIEDVKSK